MGALRAVLSGYIFLANAEPGFPDSEGLSRVALDIQARLMASHIAVPGKKPIDWITDALPPEEEK